MKGFIRSKFNKCVSSLKGEGTLFFVFMTLFFIQKSSARIYKTEEGLVPFTLV